MSESPSLTVAHIVDEGAWGGLATFVTNIVRSQAEDPAIGKIHLVCDPGKMDPALARESVQIHAYATSRRLTKLPAVTAAIANTLRRIAPDVVYLHSSFPGLWGRLISSRSWKTIYCSHGWAFTQQIGAGRRYFYYVVEALLSRRTDAIVSISESEFQAAERAGIRPRIHRLIRHGIGPAEPQSGPVLERASNTINMLFVGRFDRQKGLDRLLDVLGTPELAHITLWLAGRNIIGEGVSIPRRSNVRELGWLPNRVIDSVMRQVDVVVVPSRWEGFGLVVLEAMRNAKPIIASDVGGLGELVQDGVNGRKFDFADVTACRRALSSITLSELEAMGAKGLQIYQEKFQWELCYKAWSTLTNEVLESG